MSDTKTVQRITHKYSIFTRTVFYNKYQYENLLNKKNLHYKICMSREKKQYHESHMEKKSFLCSLSSIPF